MNTENVKQLGKWFIVASSTYRTLLALISFPVTSFYLKSHNIINKSIPLVYQNTLSNSILENVYVLQLCIWSKIQ